MPTISTSDARTVIRRSTAKGFALAVLLLFAATPVYGQTSPVRCSPSLQETPVGVAVRITASEGDGSYTWNVDPGAVQEDGMATWRSYRWTTIGTKTVSVASAGRTADCVVIVRSEAETGSAETVLTAVKQARNVTRGDTIFRDALEVRNNHEVIFAILITNTSDEDVGPLLVQDTLPSGFVPLSGSTFIGDVPVSSDAITSGGIVISSLARNSSITVTWTAVGSRINLLPRGTRQETPAALVLDQGGTSASANDTITLSILNDGTVPTPTGGLSTVGTIPTGPGAATLLALSFAVVSSLLYAAYTRSSSFRHREIDRISMHDRMDFRS